MADTRHLPQSLSTLLFETGVSVNLELAHQIQLDRLVSSPGMQCNHTGFSFCSFVLRQDLSHFSRGCPPTHRDHLLLPVLGLKVWVGLHLHGLGINSGLQVFEANWQMLYKRSHLSSPKKQF